MSPGSDWHTEWEHDSPSSADKGGVNAGQGLVAQWGPNYESICMGQTPDEAVGIPERADEALLPLARGLQTLRWATLLPPGRPACRTAAALSHAPVDTVARPPRPRPAPGASTAAARWVRKAALWVQVFRSRAVVMLAGRRPGPAVLASGPVGAG